MRWWSFSQLEVIMVKKTPKPKHPSLELNKPRKIMLSKDRTEELTVILFKDYQDGFTKYHGDKHKSYI